MNGKLVGYVCVGTNDLDRAKGFYDNLFSSLEISGFAPGARGYFYQVGGGASTFGVIKPENGNEATVGNGSMAGLSMDSKEKVDELYAKALELGATDEGAPGARTETFYGAYFRDLDGNKIALYYLG